MSIGANQRTSQELNGTTHILPSQKKYSPSNRKPLTHIHVNTSCVVNNQILHKREDRSWESKSSLTGKNIKIRLFSPEHEKRKNHRVNTFDSSHEQNRTGLKIRALLFSPEYKQRINHHVNSDASENFEYEPKIAVQEMVNWFANPELNQHITDRFPEGTSFDMFFPREDIENLGNRQVLNSHAKSKVYKEKKRTLCVSIREAIFNGKTQKAHQLIQDWNRSESASVLGVTPLNPIAYDKDFYGLFNAVREKNLDSLQQLVKTGASIHVQDEYKNTLLHLAAFIGALDIVSYLLEQGADYKTENAEWKTPLYFAAQQGHQGISKAIFEKYSISTQFSGSSGDQVFRKQDDIFQSEVLSAIVKEDILTLDRLVNWCSECTGKKIAEIVNAKNKFGDTLLEISLERNSDKLVEFLFEKGADGKVSRDSYRTVVYFTALGKHLKVAKALVQSDDNKGFEVLCKLLSIKEIDDLISINLLKIFHNNGVDFQAKNKHNNTLLHFAAIGKSEAVVQCLIDLGLDCQVKNNQQETALWFAGIKKSLSTMRPLIKADKDKGSVELFQFIQQKDIKEDELMEILKLFEVGGANLKVKEPKGNTLLHWAAFKRCPEIVKYLISIGLDSAVANHAGKTALFYAARRLCPNSVAEFINVDPNDGETVLFQIIKQTELQELFFLKVLETLVENGAYINAKETKAQLLQLANTNWSSEVFNYLSKTICSDNFVKQQPKNDLDIPFDLLCDES